MTFDDGDLDRLVPPLPWESDWVDVLGRAGELDQRRREPWARRRRLLGLAGVAALLIALIALGAASEWLFR